MTNAVSLAQQASTGVSQGFKNRIINGAMGIWQRGTSSSSTGYQTVDRWSFYADSSRTVSRSTDVPTGFQYSTSLSGTGSTGLTQKIESVNCYGIAGNSITISFWLKQTTGAGSNAIGLNLYYANAADDWNASTQISTTQNFTTTSGWAQYSATFSNMPANSVNGLQVTIVTNSGSAVVFLLTGVQLEVGSSATSFEYRSIGTELGLCQRYYEKSYNQSVAVPTVTYDGISFETTWGNAANRPLWDRQFAVVKRAAATMTFYSPNSTTAGKCGGPSGADYNCSLNYAGQRNFTCYQAGGSGATVGADWYLHWAASAEL